MSRKINRRHFIAAGSAAVATPFLLRGASAQGAWPSRNIRMVCSYPAGGQTDLLARAFSDYIGKQIGQTVVVENKAGASGSIGAAEVARAAPDGHTMLCSISTTYVMNRVMMKNPGYDMDKDLALVSVIPGAGLLLVANKQSGIKSLDDFVAFSRKKGQVNFGTYSAGSSPHMTINELNKQYGLKIEPIHYRGEAPMWTGPVGRHARCGDGQLHRRAGGAAKQSRHGIRGAFEEGRCRFPRSRRCPNKARPRNSSPLAVSPAGRCRRRRRSRSSTGCPKFCVAANNDPKVKEVLATFALEPAIGHKESDRALSARIADLDRERAGARPGAGLARKAPGG